MGCFSWTFCDVSVRHTKDGYPDPTDGQRLCIGRKGYVLVPKAFGGKTVSEPCYKGDGYFGGRDIYELCADWNREWLAKNPDWVLPSMSEERSGIAKEKPVSAEVWYPLFADLSHSPEEVERLLKVDRSVPEYMTEYRWIGIWLSSYDNEWLKYPIKIARNKRSVYEECHASEHDPKQGCM